MSSSVTIRKSTHIGGLQCRCVFSLGVLAILSLAPGRPSLLLGVTWLEPDRHDVFGLEDTNSERYTASLPQIDRREVLQTRAALTASPSRQPRNESLPPGRPTVVGENPLAENPVYAPKTPMAWYKFDGNANDSSGAAHGQLRGSPTYTQGIYGQAIRLDGYRDSVQITGAADLFSNIRTGITIAFWQYGTASTHRRDTLCCSSYTNGQYHPAVAINLGCWKQPGEYNWDCGRSGSSSDRLSGKHRAQSEWSGQWNHWAFTKDAPSGKMQIFLNGSLFDSRTGAHSVISGITSFEIGSGWYGGYDGLIDDFRIYDYSLSQPEITYIATNGTGILRNSCTAPADLYIGGGRSGTCEHHKFVLEHMRSDQCIAFLSQLGLDGVSPIPEANAVLIAAPPDQLRRVSLVLDIVDAKEDFVIENIGPASAVRTLPSNLQIAAALGDVMIGTFADPPWSGAQTRGIIDIHEGAVIAIIPARHREQLLDLLTRTAADTMSVRSTSAPNEPHESDYAESVFEPYTNIEAAQPKARTFVHEAASAEAHVVPVHSETYLRTELGSQILHQTPQMPYLPGQKTLVANSKTQETTRAGSLPVTEDGTVGPSRSSTFILKPVKETAGGVVPTDKSETAKLANGEDVLDFDFPDTMTLAQLLELAGEYLDLDCVYDPDVVGNKTVTLKLRGSLEGEMRIKDLYTLLETVLKFNGLAMIRRGDKLVTVVPVGEALDADPRWIDSQNKAVQAGDIVVTRMFELRYVDVASVTNLLQNMKLGVAVSSSEDAQILFVTCYAHRMSRIEQLVSMLDRPGRSRECRVRRLQYTAAPAITEKLRTLAQELQGVPVAQASEVGKSTPPQSKGLSGSKAGASVPKVYIDTDERTNRILMIGFQEQLSVLEELIGILDVAEKDLRAPRVYDVRHMTAQEALDKLQELEVLGSSALSAGSPSGPGTPYSAKAGRTHNGLPTEEPLVIVLEATNQLLVRATQEQHDSISEFLGHIDVAREDRRILQTYEVQYVEAEEVKRKLEELDMIRASPTTFPEIKPGIRSANPGTAKPLTTSTSGTAEVLMEEPRVVVNESVNSLLVTATAEQHTRIAGLIDYLDRKLPEEDIPYRIYPLENSSPSHVADLMKQIIQGTVKKDKEGKIEEALKKEEQITIVPDPNTFSLVIYASRKNQEWIANLIKGLDKRRPQVLIDVTLVEVTRTDTFEYDLNLVASADNAVIGNVGIEPIHRIDSESRLEASFNLLGQDGNPTGETRAFYSDEKVQALLSAIQRKNYGRVLAKPKILVDDGQQGEISTTDETTYAKEAIQIPNQGPSITTRDFEKIEATIQLQITPHISDSNLLRLDVHLSREDFGARPTEGAPPDKATSQVTTTVFVPDNHTVILGGLVKLNQSKGGSKVPILGDIPLVGILFRSIENNDLEKKLYVFLKANIVRPYDETGTADLQKISQQQRETFETSEAEFQKHEGVPGLKPKPMQPERVLEEP